MKNSARTRDATDRLGARIARGGIWVLLNRVLVAGTQLLILMLLARLLPPGELGIYFIISNLVIIGSVLVQLGIPQVVIKQVAESLETATVEHTRSVLQSCLLLAVLSAAFFYLLYYLGVSDWLALTVFKSPAMLSLMLPVTLWLLIQAVQRVVGESFRGLHDMRLAAIFGGMFSGVLTTLVLLGFVLAFGTATLQQVVYIFLGAISLSFVVALWLLHRKVNLLARAEKMNLGGTLTLAVPILFASLGNIVLTRADIWVLGMYVSDTEVALYGSAARLINLLGMPLLMASAVLAPMIVQLHQQGDREKLQKLVQMVPTVIAVPAVLLISVFFIWGDKLLVLIYGDIFYADAWAVLNLLAAGQLICLVAGVSIQILMMTVGQRSVMVTTLLCTLLALAASVWMVDEYGIVGVALAFAVALGLQSISAIVLCKTSLGMNTHVSLASLSDLRGMRELLRSRRNRQSEIEAKELS